MVDLALHAKKEGDVRPAVTADQEYVKTTYACLTRISVEMAA